MVEFVELEYEKFTDDAELQAEYKSKQASFAKRKEEIFHIIDHEPEIVIKLNNFFQNKELIEKLQSEGNYRLEYLTSSYQITSNAMEEYYKFAKFKYECGMYIDAEEMLTNYLTLVNWHYQLALGGNTASNPPSTNITVANISQHLNNISTNSSHKPSFNLTTFQGALWGRLACRIVQGE
jgi:hypothetical protein